MVCTCLDYKIKLKNSGKGARHPGFLHRLLRRGRFPCSMLHWGHLYLWYLFRLINLNRILLGFLRNFKVCVRVCGKDWFHLLVVQNVYSFLQLLWQKHHSILFPENEFRSISRRNFLMSCFGLLSDSWIRSGPSVVKFKFFKFLSAAFLFTLFSQLGTRKRVAKCRSITIHPLKLHQKSSVNHRTQHLRRKTGDVLTNVIINHNQCLSCQRPLMLYTTVFERYVPTRHLNEREPVIQTSKSNNREKETNNLIATK